MASVEGGSVAAESTVPVPGILRRVLPPERLAEIAQAVKAVQDKRGGVPITFLGSFFASADVLNNLPPVELPTNNS